MNIYEVCLGVNDDAIDVKAPREIHAKSHREAAIVCLKVTHHADPARAGIAKGNMPVAWVWLQNSPKHSTGVPMQIHRIEFGRAS